SWLHVGVGGAKRSENKTGDCQVGEELKRCSTISSSISSSESRIAPQDDVRRPTSPRLMCTRRERESASCRLALRSTTLRVSYRQGHRAAQLRRRAPQRAFCEKAWACCMQTVNLSAQNLWPHRHAEYRCTSATRGALPRALRP